MKVTSTALPEVLLLEPDVFHDIRGFFYESFNQEVFNNATGTHHRFVQDNHTRSRRRVLRGLHYQISPWAQGKLVRVVRGAVWDVAVDMRRNSDTFGRWVGAELSEDNRHQLWIPSGFAHGFVTLTDFADVFYKLTNYYKPEFERGVAWDDPDLNIEWPDMQGEWLLSEKDRGWQCLRMAEWFD